MPFLVPSSAVSKNAINSLGESAEKKDGLFVPGRRLFWGLSFIFFLSGTSALIYQVVWQRVLTLYYGVGSVSTALIVSVYMFGLGLGAVLGGFLSERVRAKIRLYFFIELSIGLFGLISIPFLDFVGRQTAGSDYSTTFLFLFLILCVPTVLMGTTLPILTKFYNGFNHNFFDSVSYLYFINTVGAAFGSVLASFVLISFGGLDKAVYFASSVNFLLAVMILALWRVPSVSSPEPLHDRQERPQWVLGRAAYSWVFITGFLAIGYEIISMRICGVLVKDSPYAFSSILSVYLLGIGLGSFAMNRFIKKCPTDMRRLFFAMQFFLAVSVLLIYSGFYYLTQYTPFQTLVRLTFVNDYHPLPFLVDYSHVPVADWQKPFWTFFQAADIFVWPLALVFIPTLFLGAGFPLISRLALTDSRREGVTVGYVYFFNVIGNVAGAILVSFILLPTAGTERILLIFVIVGLMFSFLITGRGRRKLFCFRILTLALILGGIYFLPVVKGRLYQAIHQMPEKGKYNLYLEEGVEGVVLTAQRERAVANFINGVRQGGRPGFHFYHKTIEALTYTRKPENIMIIGLGTGSLLEMTLLSPEVRQITLVEINTTLIKNLRKMPLFVGMLNDPRINIITDDARRYLLRSREMFDAVLTTPPRVTAAYMNNINSREFFALINKHLKPEGIFMIWADDAMVIPKTLSLVFPHMKVYASFCLCSQSRMDANLRRRQSLYSRLDSSDMKAVADFFQSKDAKTGGMYFGEEDLVAAKYNKAPVNEDLTPATEYYLGLKSRYKDN